MTAWENQGGPQGQWFLRASDTHWLFVWWWDGREDVGPPSERGAYLPFGYAVTDDEGLADLRYAGGYAPDLETAQRLAVQSWQAGPVERQSAADDSGDLMPF